MTMTNPATRSVKDLLAAATPLPWEVLYESCDCGGDYPCRHGEYPTHLVAPEHKVTRYAGSPFECEEAAEIADFLEAQDANQADVDLIAYAVNHLPDYEAAIDVLESVVAYFEGMGLDAPVGGLHLRAYHAVLVLRGES